MKWKNSNTNTFFIIFLSGISKIANGLKVYLCFLDEYATENILRKN